MAKKPRRGPLLGFNNNVNWKGTVFHVQTEDSGLDKPHVITHLFTEGTILATKKTSYNDLVDDPDVDEKVRKLMRDQHKNMFLALRDGTYKEYVKQDIVPEMPPDLQQKAAEAVAHKESPVAGTISGAARAAATQHRVKGIAPREQTISSVIKREIRSASTPSADTARESDVVPSRPAAPPPERRQPVSRRVEIPTLRRQKVPVEPSQPGRKIMPAKPEGRPTKEAKSISPPPIVSRPKSIFSIDEKEEKGFGEEVISERSLDEVILGFLDDDED